MSFPDSAMSSLLARFDRRPEAGSHIPEHVPLGGPMKIWLFAILLLGVAVSTISAQERPGLFLREDWKEIPAATPVTQEHVSHPDLLVTRHGSGEAGIKKSHHDRPADDPYYIWSGEAEGNWALSLRNPKSQVDLTG